MKVFPLQTKNTVNQKISSNVSFPFPVEKINTRQSWAANRLWMENEALRLRLFGRKSRLHRWCYVCAETMLKWALHCSGLYQKGVRNAYDIVLREIPIYLPNLPKVFNGFTILHLSDLHVENMPGLLDQILRVIDQRKVDLCVLTGDYRAKFHGPAQPVIEQLKQLVDGISSGYGFIGVLGNHDSCHIVNPLEEIGIRMLINESRWIHKSNERFQIIGTDDVNLYYTEQALHALESAKEGCTIALVHSPELYDVASEMGVDLYLCGHTHAGQICLPGGKAVVKGALKKGQQYYRGIWKYENMQGVTHAGVGTSGFPVRFNTRGELLLLRLYQG